MFKLVLHQICFFLIQTSTAATLIDRSSFQENTASSNKHFMEAAGREVSVTWVRSMCDQFWLCTFTIFQVRVHKDCNYYPTPDCNYLTIHHLRLAAQSQ